MPEINVVTPFTLTLDDHTTQTFQVGKQEVSDEIAAHWYVRAHTDHATPVEPAPLTDAEVSAALAAARTAEENAADAAKQAEEGALRAATLEAEAAREAAKAKDAEASGKSRK
jgi:hypothetical protein